jgi:nicotinate-nucleotide adenylyltransferase
VNTKKVGIMGGTFDPIHYGHLLIAENAADQFNLDEVIFMPTGRSPHKSPLAVTKPKLRCDMVALAIQKNPKFSLSYFEVESLHINYTFQTIESITAQYPHTDLFFILGGDSLFDFDSWKYPEKIIEQVSILAAVRDDWDGVRFDTQIAYLNQKYNNRIFRLNTPSFAVSSHVIRNLIAIERSVRYMLPDEVLSYIKAQKLYINND